MILHIESLNCPHIIDELQQAILKEYPNSIQSVLVTAKKGIAYVNVGLNQFKDCHQGIKKIEWLKGIINVSKTDS